MMTKRGGGDRLPPADVADHDDANDDDDHND